MCEKCKKTNAKVESVIKKVGAAELVEIMGLVVGHEDDASPIDRLFSVLKFSSMIDEMVSKPKCSPDSVKADETNASKDREIAGLKSSLAMLLAAFKLMSSQAGFKMPELNSDDPMAVRQLLGAMADQLDDTKSRLEDMMRELTHRHDLNKQPHKTQHVHH